MKVRIVLGPEYISCQKLRTIGLAVWPVGRSLTDKQTNRQTNRGDQYTLRKSKISQSNKQTNIQTDRGDQYTLRKSEISQSNERALEASAYFAKILFFEIALLIIIC